MAYMDRIRECSVYDPSKYVPFMVDDDCIGQIKVETVECLRGYNDVFALTDEAVHLQSGLNGFDERTTAFSQVTAAMRQDGLVPGWRDEPYPVGAAFNLPPLFEMERAAVPLFGVRGYGVHMNGWLSRGTDTYMWVGRRSLNKPTGPGKLDQMVAGGQPAGLSLFNNLIKECDEEAGIPEDIAVQAKPVGTISYMTGRAEGLRNDVLFNFDLEVPDGFTPVNQDGEVAEFMLWPIEQVIEKIQNTEEFKFNAALVIIDFLVRRGFIPADDPDYVDILAGLHQ